MDLTGEIIKQIGSKAELENVMAHISELEEKLQSDLVRLHSAVEYLSKTTETEHGSIDEESPYFPSNFREEDLSDLGFLIERLLDTPQNSMDPDTNTFLIGTTKNYLVKRYRRACERWIVHYISFNDEPQERVLEDLDYAQLEKYKALCHKGKGDIEIYVHDRSFYQIASRRGVLREMDQDKVISQAKGWIPRASEDLLRREWAREMASKCTEDPRVRISFDDFFTAFLRYKNASEDNETKSIREIVDELPITEKYFSGILNREKLPSLCRKKREVPKVNWKILQAAYQDPEFEFTDIDVTYFLGINYGAFYRHKQRNAQEFDFKQQRKGWIQRLRMNAVLSLNIASQIYKAQDQGVGTEEILENERIKPVPFKYATENRPEIEQKIVYGLRSLFPDREINTPYL